MEFNVWLMVWTSFYEGFIMYAFTLNDKKLIKLIKSYSSINSSRIYHLPNSVFITFSALYTFQVYQNKEKKSFARKKEM